MAGGKMSPRQKMINLMYLVFIAMMALSMGKEVLTAFGSINEKLTENNNSTTQKNEAAYSSLNTKATDQPEKYLPLKQKADRIKNASNKLNVYIDSLKSKMLFDQEDKKNYEVMDRGDFLDENFFVGDKYSKTGTEFVNEINEYKATIASALGTEYKSLANSITALFSTEDQVDSEGVTKKWLNYHFEGFPLIASLTKLTQMQVDIKNSESNVLTTMLGGQLESEVSLSNYKGIVQLDKTAYYVGEKVTGKVVLGRYDASMVPDKVTLNGRNYTNIDAGQVILDLRASKLGDNDIKGKITFKENNKDVDVEFNSSYTVIPEPNDAVISADAMNVVYRGVDNPVSVSLPGVSNNNLRVTASGGNIIPTGSSYIIKPGKGSEMTINVGATLSSGKKINSSKKFRVKDIPAAMGSARGEFGLVKMPKTSAARVVIGAGLPDFVFDLKLKVTSFKVKVQGQLTVLVNGTTFNAAAKKALQRARRGDVVTIFDIEAVIENNTSYKLKKVLPVSIEISN
ncbi:type IX secretion system motor protein PorM/GldM [Polaribacter gochangensis]|uniref:type IX secretion system motor protein PorM/GldM n=1 Tax=Polaribacter gochangensis TaxID=3252903 RepID=UPI003904BA99